MQNETDQQDKIEKQTQTKLTKMDIVKISAAGSGCVISGCLALLLYLVALGKTKNALLTDCAVYTSIPLYLLVCKLLKFSESEENLCKIVGCSGVFYGTIALALAAYLYQKLAKLRSNKSIESDSIFIKKVNT